MGNECNTTSLAGLFFPAKEVALFAWTLGGTEVSQCNGSALIDRLGISRMAFINGYLQVMGENG